MESAHVSGQVEMRVVGVRWAPSDEDGRPRHAVLLEEVDGARQLAIWIGEPEALALALAREGKELPRPGTYRFAAGLLEAAGARLGAVIVTGVVEGTFHAQAVLEGPEGERRVDARPSDALNLAVVLGAPVRVEPAVLESAARDVPELRAEGLGGFEISIPRLRPR